jgi:Tol biopolymer transport system component
MVATGETVQREIWQAPLGPDAKANAKAAVRLLDSTQSPWWQHTSPLGLLLLYNSPAAGRRNLWALPLERPGPPRQITTFTSGSVTHSAWSPDESRIAYCRTENGNADIWVVNKDGSNPLRLTSHAAPDFWPTWSHDGKWVAFSSSRDGVVRIWKAPSGGGDAVRISDRPGYRSNWSPTDSRIAWWSAGSGIEIVDANTGELIRRIASADTHPTWSPDGKRIAAVQGDGGRLVYVFDASTGERVSAIEFPDNFHAIFRACWSRDARSLIINRQEYLSHIVLVENFQ